MQVSVEKTSELSRKMTVRVPESVIQEKVKDRIRSLAREVRLDGFRPGKVPQKVVEKMYGARVRGEITGELIQSTYYDAITDQDLKPAGPPNIVPVDQSGSAEGFEYVADFEVFPEFTLESVQKIKVSKPVVTIEESDIDNVVEKLRQQKKTWKQVQRAAEKSDKVTISFSGQSENENFTDGKVEDYPVEIGAGQMIPGFEDHLIGLEIDESKTFDIDFPEDYGNNRLAGKTATFEIQLSKVEEPVVPEIDTEFVKAYGVEDGDLEAFRKDVKGNMEFELEQALRNRLKTAVMDGLYGAFDISLPKSMVDQEIEVLMKPHLERAKKQNLNINELDLPRENFEEQARRRVALGLILSEIIHSNQIESDSDRVRATINDMAKSYEQPEEVVNWYYADNKRLAEIKQLVLEDQAVEWVLEQVQVTEDPVSFDEIMNNQ